METALDVLSRAATMVQDNSNETRLTSKELPTTAWRRERRMRTGEYHHPLHHPSSGSSSSSARALSPSSSPPPAAHVQHSPISSNSVSSAKAQIHSNSHQISIMMAAAAAATVNTNHPLPASPPPHSTIAEQINFDDAPLDMSVGNLKHRNSPPPPYREPLPGSQFASSVARPSVITQAPPKRDVKESTLVVNRENDNRSCESIDEHFRRSLGNDYFALFSKRSPNSQSADPPSPQTHNPQPKSTRVRSPSPILAVLSGVSSMHPHTAVAKSELIPPPSYPANLPSSNQQQNSQQAHQNPVLLTSKSSTVLLSPSVSLVAAQMKIATGPNTPLPLVVRPSTQPIGLQKLTSLIAVTPLTSPQLPTSIPGVNTGNSSRTSSPLPLHQHQHQQQQSSATAVTLSHLASIENSPSSSPRHTPPVVSVPVLNPSPNLPAIMRIKTEPGLQNTKSHNPTPPASPTSTTNNNINSNCTNYSSNTPSPSPSPSSPITSSWKSSTNAGNSSADVLASVDDHFAKALGDTWKKLQESKDIRK